MFCKDIDLVVNTKRTKYREGGRHLGMVANEHIKVDSISNDIKQ